ncbi:rhomboid family intramembrane serine protease [Simiduia sp. 21SJ11W-1]|uniref:rhomboid family intramembrane serine protease n=1 Tax=Simiduia sp. 21SJ11W-1 TaxID=2909669 RepID=UPI00209CC454|nr:rhomboid family intramembrane serine protease [Simiduia sp. 21SJ11W-1]UTA47800.1 rhomboid family intramembrane serine protease [Simiduia sp. 21SJ11W-1]
MIILPTEKRFDARHTPTVLIGIVLLNILVFFFYQGDDNNKIYSALSTYEEQNFLEIEWPLIQDYLKAQNELDALDDLLDLHDDKQTQDLMVHILLRTDFYQHVFRNPYQLIGFQNADRWLEHRGKINRLIENLSFNAYGLKPAELSFTTLISHQFLHGDVMHLLGNLFFLVFCGFAVEAAIGHLRFLGFYLLSGVAGGLAHAAVDFSSTTTLVGASGAISGVMAMYLAIFRLKKIEFFYWFFVVVGYMRAPALVILPIYIGKEIVSFYTDGGSNVAFMAHAGGFVAGSLLMLGNYFISPKTIDKAYVEEDQSIDPFQQALADIYTHIEQFRFAAAIKAVDAAIERFGANLRLAQLRVQLTQLDSEQAQRQSQALLLGLVPESQRQLQQQSELVKAQPQALALLDAELRYQLTVRLTALHDLGAAEVVFASLQQDAKPHESLGVLAKKLALAFKALHKPTKAKRYEALAQEWAGI